MVRKCRGCCSGDFDFVGVAAGYTEDWDFMQDPISTGVHICRMGSDVRIYTNQRSTFGAWSIDLDLVLDTQSDCNNIYATRVHIISMADAEGFALYGISAEDSSDDQVGYTRSQQTTTHTFSYSLYQIVWPSGHPAESNSLNKQWHITAISGDGLADDSGEVMADESDFATPAFYLQSNGTLDNPVHDKYELLEMLLRPDDSFNVTHEVREEVVPIHVCSFDCGNVAPDSVTTQGITPAEFYAVEKWTFTDQPDQGWTLNDWYVIRNVWGTFFQDDGPVMSDGKLHALYKTGTKASGGAAPGQQVTFDFATRNVTFHTSSFDDAQMDLSTLYRRPDPVYSDIYFADPSDMNEDTCKGHSGQPDFGSANNIWLSQVYHAVEPHVGGLRLDIYNAQPRPINYTIQMGVSGNGPTYTVAQDYPMFYNHSTTGNPSSTRSVYDVASHVVHTSTALTGTWTLHDMIAYCLDDFKPTLLSQTDGSYACGLKFSGVAFDTTVDTAPTPSHSGAGLPGTTTADYPLGSTQFHDHDAGSTPTVDTLTAEYTAGFLDRNVVANQSSLGSADLVSGEIVLDAPHAYDATSSIGVVITRPHTITPDLVKEDPNHWYDRHYSVYKTLSDDTTAASTYIIYGNVRDYAPGGGHDILWDPNCPATPGTNDDDKIADEEGVGYYPHYGVYQLRQNDPLQFEEVCGVQDPENCDPFVPTSPECDEAPEIDPCVPAAVLSDTRFTVETINRQSLYGVTVELEEVIDGPWHNGDADEGEGYYDNLWDWKLNQFGLFVCSDDSGSYQWYKGAADACGNNPGSDERMYKFTSAYLVDAGTYKGSCNWLIDGFAAEVTITEDSEYVDTGDEDTSYTRILENGEDVELPRVLWAENWFETAEIRAVYENVRVCPDGQHYVLSGTAESHDNGAHLISDEIQFDKYWQGNRSGAESGGKWGVNRRLLFLFAIDQPAFDTYTITEASLLLYYKDNSTDPEDWTASNISVSLPTAGAPTTGQTQAAFDWHDDNTTSNTGSIANTGTHAAQKVKFDITTQFQAHVDDAAWDGEDTLSILIEEPEGLTNGAIEFDRVALVVKYSSPAPSIVVTETRFLECRKVGQSDALWRRFEVGGNDHKLQVNYKFAHVSRRRFVLSNGRCRDTMMPVNSSGDLEPFDSRPGGVAGATLQWTLDDRVGSSWEVPYRALGEDALNWGLHIGTDALAPNPADITELDDELDDRYWQPA